MRLGFYGATGTVTGSKYVLTRGPKVDDRIMIDCGLFQGLKRLRLLNWEALPVDPMSIGAVILTHAHIDHSGYLPRLSRTGFQSPIYCTPSTAKLLEILLLDSAYLQEEAASYANNKGFSKHSPALPLYTIKDAEKCLKQVRAFPYDEVLEIGRGFKIRFHANGHILGAAYLEIDIESDGKTTKLIASGDVGRYGSPVMPDPPSPEKADYLIVESTYGDRSHDDGDSKTALRDVITRTMERDGVVVIPAFAVGRTQTILYVIRELEDEGAIPRLPVYIDSPMAIDVTMLYKEFASYLDAETRMLMEQGVAPLSPDRLDIRRSRDESRALNDIRGGAVIISASGMATGGRILHHLTQRLPYKQNTILFVGFQAEGTRGRLLLDGAEEIKIHGRYVPVRAEIASIHGFSAHADKNELLAWLGRMEKKPALTFITHGEPRSAQALAAAVGEHLGMRTLIPEYKQEVEL
ncbi:MBL fold metallo-hydrolase [bacterium]|nr:MBL fold metallo-hydrolase [candidate division CSSED10-310 bacterium]